MEENKNIWKVFKIASVQLTVDIVLAIITGEIVDLGLFAGLGMIIAGLCILKKKMEINLGIIIFIIGLIISIITIKNIARSVKSKKHTDH